MVAWAQRKNFGNLTWVRLFPSPGACEVQRFDTDARRRRRYGFRHVMWYVWYFFACSVEVLIKSGSMPKCLEADFMVCSRVLQADARNAGARADELQSAHEVQEQWSAPKGLEAWWLGVRVPWDCCGKVAAHPSLPLSGAPFGSVP